MQATLFYPKSDIIIAMTWLEIRAYYAARHAQARAGGATQKAIAAQGGTGQNSVSRLLSNDRRGPSVEIFVCAVEGLGLSLSQFFAELEAAVAARPEELAASAAASEKRPYGGSSLSDPLTPHDPARLDQQQVHAIIQAATEGLLARLDRIDARMAQLGARDGDLPASASTVRTGHPG